jgi:hypothetical protein
LRFGEMVRCSVPASNAHSCLQLFAAFGLDGLPCDSNSTLSCPPPPLPSPPTPRLPPLPRSEYVALVQRYVETRHAYEWGLVCQALAGAMRGVLQDWELMVAQLEHQQRAGRLTLQALWYYVQPPMAAMRVVATLAAVGGLVCARPCSRRSCVAVCGGVQ